MLMVMLVAAAMAAVPAGGQPSDGVVIAQADLQGLQAIRQALVDPRGFLRGWNGTGLDACSGGWAGIKCAQGKVVAIQLPFKGLAGALSDKVGQLTALRKLSLHDNALGGQLPASLGFLPELRGVYLFNNRFAGAVPPQLGGCALLQTLDLSGNFLSGAVPASLANATRLLRLNLAYNNLTGAVPSSLTSLPFLVSLQLSSNNLSGEVPPTIGNLRMLHELSLSYNLISGSIPDGIGSLSRLHSLDLSNNLLSGSLPASLCNLTSLVELKLDGNDIGGHIPDAIDGLKNLTKLSLRRNVLDGEIPATVGNISALSLLDVSENNLTGGIPESLSGLNNLTSFNVSYNNLSGPVPVALSSKFNASSFAGNIQLCGYNGSAICTSISSPATMASPPVPLSQRPTRKLNKRELIFAVGGICLLFLLLFCCVLLFWRKDKQESESPKKGAKDATAKAAAGKSGGGGGGSGGAGGDGGGKLVHFDGPLSFTADDLLCATAEILGKSTYGTVYKATMENGTFVAVKRLREKIAKNQKEFEAEVNALGKLRHPNLLALRAYYLGPKGEKLLVFDFMTKGNLTSFLHGNQARLLTTTFFGFLFVCVLCHCFHGSAIDVALACRSSRPGQPGELADEDEHRDGRGPWAAPPARGGEHRARQPDEQQHPARRGERRQDRRLRPVAPHERHGQLQRHRRGGRAGLPRAGALQAEEGQRQDGHLQPRHDHARAPHRQVARRHDQRPRPAAVGGLCRGGGVDQRGVRP
jgi:Leucine-rich repeat (LRR) protein